jgi:hypothetical protein
MLKKNFRNGVSSSKLQKRYGGWFQIDRRLYKTLFSNIAGLVTNKPHASLYCVQIAVHLLGKLYGSVKVGTINLQ